MQIGMTQYQIRLCQLILVFVQSALLIYLVSLYVTLNFLTADVNCQLFMMQRPRFCQQINILHLLSFDKVSFHQHHYPHQSVLQLMLWSFIVSPIYDLHVSPSKHG
jgi:hypothetical protein